MAQILLDHVTDPVMHRTTVHPDGPCRELLRRVAR
jgi:hypothetical protein